MRPVALTIPAFLLLAACSSGSTASRPHTSAVSTTQGATPSPSADPGPATTTPSRSAPAVTGKVPAGIALTEADLTAAGASGTFMLIDGGDTLTDATLDECGGTFPSEAHRVARQQIEAKIDASNDVSNEVVSYDSPADAMQALTELGAAVKACDPKATIAGSGGGTEMFDYTAHTVDDPTLPIPANEIDVATDHGTDSSGAAFTEHGIAIVQVSGSVLDAVYLNSGASFNQTSTNLATALAKATGARLAAGVNAT